MAKLPPSMMTLQGICAPVVRAENRLREIWSAASEVSGFVVVDHGLFALMISTFEVMIGDCLRYYLLHNPGVLDLKEATFDKRDFFEKALINDLLKIKVERKVRNTMYGTLEASVKTLLSTLKIKRQFNQEAILFVIEAKETRNLLLHNDLIINDEYEQKAGVKKRSPRASIRCEGPPRLEISAAYFHTIYECILTLVQELKAMLTSTYQGMTRLAVFRSLWSYLVNAEFAPFEEYWRLDEAKDCITGILSPEREVQMGRTEKLFLGLWRVNVTGTASHQFPILLNGLDATSKRKLHFLIRVSSEFGLT